MYTKISWREPKPDSLSLVDRSCFSSFAFFDDVFREKRRQVMLLLFVHMSTELVNLVLTILSDATFDRIEPFYLHYPLYAAILRQAFWEYAFHQRAFLLRLLWGTGYPVMQTNICVSYQKSWRSSWDINMSTCAPLPKNVMADITCFGWSSPPSATILLLP